MDFLEDRLTLMSDPITNTVHIDIEDFEEPLDEIKACEDDVLAVVLRHREELGFALLSDEVAAEHEIAVDQADCFVECDKGLFFLKNYLEEPWQNSLSYMHHLLVDCSAKDSILFKLLLELPLNFFLMS